MPRFESIIEPNEEIFGVQEASLKEVSELLPKSRVELIGAMAVPMMGREELDLLIISDDISGDSQTLVNAGFKQGPVVNETSFLKKMVGKIEVAVQILGPDHKMIGVHHKILGLLRSNETLRKEYEIFKQNKLSGLTREDYRKKKSEWLEEHILPLVK